MSGQRWWSITVIVWLTLAGGAPGDELRSILIDAQEQFEQTNYDQALKLYKQADEAESGHAAVEYNTGLCHWRLGDGNKAIERFEHVASQQDIAKQLRCDAFYNVGLIRAQSSLAKLEALSAPASQPAEAVPLDSPANIEALQEMAAELLTAIGAFRQSREIEPTADAEHNIRAARIMRRNVLGLLRRAMEAKEKKDILDDPRAYLEALALEQDRQVALTRLLVMNPPPEPAELRQARRTSVRLQRKIMERTGLLADHLAQYREASAGATDPNAPTSQPADETPRDKIYHAVAGELEKVVQLQRDACAFFLDGEIAPAGDNQFQATDAMYKALFAFPIDPAKALAQARTKQAVLQKLIADVVKKEDWLWEPVLGEVNIPPGSEREPDKTGIHYHQTLVIAGLLFLRAQSEAIVAASTQPADAGGLPETHDNPMLDPELNEKLAEVLKEVQEIAPECLGAITERNKTAVLASQQKLLDIIDAALVLLPKSLPERIRELVVRQDRLNSETAAQADDENKESASPLDEVRQWAARLKSALLPSKPAKVVGELRGQQDGIKTDTVAVREEIKQQIPAGSSTTQPAPAPPGSTDQSSQIQALIEAGKHLSTADSEMGSAMDGLDKAVVENSLKPIRAEGPVQTAQGKALEALVKALLALQPPESQPDDQQQDQQKQDQQQPDDQDIQRAVDQLDREREQAQQELYKRRARTVIKDW